MEQNTNNEDNIQRNDNKQFKISMLDFSEQSTIHGVRYIFNPGHKRSKRVVWSLLIAGFTAVLLYSLTDSLLKYYSYKTVTSTDIYNAEQIALPSITVCPNILVSDEGIHTNFHPNESEVLINEIKPFILRHSFNLSDEALKIISSISLKDYLYRILPSNLISDCTVKSETFDCTEFSEVFFSIDHGICFRFHSQKYISKHDEVRLHHQGHSHSFNVKINSNPFGNDISLFKDEFGIHVKVHSQNVHLPDMSDNSFGVPSWGTIYVAMEKHKNELLGKPHSKIDCVKNRPGSENIDSYSAENCRSKCRLDMVLEECNCTIDESAYRFCTLLDLNCIVNLRNTTYQEKAKQKCKYCMPSCHEVQYSRTVTVRQIDELHTQLIFYFNSMRVTSFRQVPSVDLINLLSEIGGLMGLCVGASLISIFECVDFFVLYIWSKMANKKGKINTISGKE